MATKIIPTDVDSVVVIRDITPNITTVSMPLLAMSLFKFGGRATIGKSQNTPC
jgi:hypothetical protein